MGNTSPMDPNTEKVLKPLVIIPRGGTAGSCVFAFIFHPPNHQVFTAKHTLFARGADPEDVLKAFQKLSNRSDAQANQ